MLHQGVAGLVFVLERRDAPSSLRATIATVARDGIHVWRSAKYGVRKKAPRLFQQKITTDALVLPETKMASDRESLRLDRIDCQRA